MPVSRRRSCVRALQLRLFKATSRDARRRAARLVGVTHPSRTAPCVLHILENLLVTARVSRPIRFTTTAYVRA